MPRDNGLSGAVIEGFRVAAARWVCVMDGDLQHPPEFIKTLAETAEARNVTLVCATRYCDGGDHHGLQAVRSLLSRASTHAAKWLFPRALSGVSDPMSGFFLVRRDAVDVDRLRPRGFKILLEIMVRQGRPRAVEAPYRFDERGWGDSKASVRQGLEYLAHLCILRASTFAGKLPTLRRTARFAAVGVLGMVVNELVLWLLVHQGVTDYVIGAVIATQVAIMFNFVLSDVWVFANAATRPLAGRFWKFWWLSNALFILSLPLLATLVSGFGMNYVIANGIAIGAQFAVRLVVSDRRIWPRADKDSEIVIDPRRAPTPTPRLRLVADPEDLESRAPDRGSVR